MKKNRKHFFFFLPSAIAGLCLFLLFFFAVAWPLAQAQDLPPRGRSVFDYLLDTQQGQGKTFKTLKVPYPFERLLELVKKQTKVKDRLALSVLFVPFGRSLQRFAAEPDFFKFPRVLVAPVSQPDYSEKRIEMDLRDNLYIAYAQPSNMLEIISYNFAAARYEFQIVKNYQQGKQPEVYYAPRALCTTCHEGEVPIFPAEPWSETNDNDLLANAMVAARGSELYFGYPIKLTDMPGRIFAEKTQKFDFNILGSGKKHLAHSVIEKICQGTKREVITCRALGLKAAFAAHFNYWPGKDWDLLKRYSALMDRYYHNHKVLRIPFPFLPDRDPVNNVGVFGESHHGAVAYFPHKKMHDNVTQMADNLRSLPPAHDPKKSRIHELKLDRRTCRIPLKTQPTAFKKYCNTNYFLSIFSNEDTLYLRDLVSGTEEFNFNKFAAVVDKMAAEALSSAAAALAQPKLQRRLLLRDFIYYAKKRLKKPQVCCQKPILAPPQLLETGVTLTSLFDKNVRQLLLTCGRCHSKPGFDYPLQFLSGPDEKSLKAKIMANSSRIIESINSKSSPMPPTHSQEARAFSAKMRRKLIQYLAAPGQGND